MLKEVINTSGEVDTEIIEFVTKMLKQYPGSG